MWPFTRAAKPPSPRLAELDDRLLVVEKAIDWLKKSDRELNARISAVQRVANREAREETAAETDSTPDIGGEQTPAPSVEPQQQRAFPRSRRGF